jgi:serine/threonine protein phosphatase PrpC
MKRQTAVEWLAEKIWKLDDQYYTVPQWLLEDIEQAKEMEKQQIVEAHGNKEKKSGGVSNATYILTGEEYYNEQFKK